MQAGPSRGTRGMPRPAARHRHRNRPGTPGNPVGRIALPSTNSWAKCTKTVDKIMKASLKLGLKGLTPARVRELALHVATGMKDNPDFPAPPVAAAQLEEMADRLGLAITEAHEGSRASKLQRDDQVQAVCAVLRRMADYVRMQAAGNAAMIESSGFGLAKKPAQPQVLPAPTIIGTRMTGRSGEMELRWSGVRNRRIYHIAICEQLPTNEGAEWRLAAVTGKVAHLMQGLEPYRAYWFRVTAVGAMGEGLPSEPVLGRAA